MKISPRAGYYLPQAPRATEAGEPVRRNDRNQEAAQGVNLPQKTSETDRTAPSGPYQASPLAVVTGDDLREIIPAEYYERGMIVNTWA